MVSVIVPIYNAEHYLNRTIESIRNQTSTDWELILVDDGSTDNSYQICKQYEEIDSRVKIICQKNKGVSAARNTGLCVASGTYVAFCDSDDFYEPDYLATFEYYSQRKQADIYIFGVYIDYPEQTPILHHPPIECTDSIHRVGEMVESWFDIYWMGLWNKIYNRQIIEDNGIRFQNGICYDEDSIFNLSYLAACKSVFCSDKPEYHYVQQNGSSLTRTFSPERLETVNQVEEKLYALAQHNNVDMQIVKKMCRSRKLDMAYSQLYRLMEIDMEKHEKKRYAQLLKEEIGNVKLSEILAYGWRNVFFHFPYWLIQCLFFEKKTRKRT